MPGRNKIDKKPRSLRLFSFLLISLRIEQEEFPGSLIPGERKRVGSYLVIDLWKVSPIEKFFIIPVRKVMTIISREASTLTDEENRYSFIICLALGEVHGWCHVRYSGAIISHIRKTPARTDRSCPDPCN
jgi:hypothetical protein